MTIMDILYAPKVFCCVKGIAICVNAMKNAHPDWHQSDKFYIDEKRVIKLMEALSEAYKVYHWDSIDELFMTIAKDWQAWSGEKIKEASELIVHYLTVINQH